MKANEKLFVIVRRDLSTSQQAVQAGHAVARYLLTYSDTEWNNGTLIYLGVKNEEDILKWRFRLSLKNAPYVVFSEPDLNNEITAIATDCEESLLKNLQVL